MAVMEDEKRDPYVAPKDADEFERQDGPRLRRLVYRHLGGLRPEDQADAAAEIMEKLVQKELWSQYSDKTESRHTGKPVTWSYFSGQLAVRYCIGKLEQYGRRFTREPLWVDKAVGDGHTTWGEQYGRSTEDKYESLHEYEFFEHVRDYLAIHPQKAAPLSMLTLIDTLLDRARCGESTSTVFISRHFSLPMAEAKKVMELLRSLLAKAAEEHGEEIHKFVLGGVELAAADLAVAVDRLKTLKGNRVSPAFRGHPLEMAEPHNRWYIDAARAEIRRRPELKQDKGKHAAGTANGGHTTQVKMALIAMFERMLVEAGGPEPESPLTQAEIFQSNVWRLNIPGLKPAHVDALTDAFLKTVDR